VLQEGNLGSVLAAAPSIRVTKRADCAHTSVSKLSEPLGLVSGPPREVFTERDRLFPSRSLPYIATHTGGSHAFAF
jgi:hypothetical protein